MKQTSILFFCICFSLGAQSQESKSAPELTEIWAPVPKTVAPGQSAADPPSDAIVLYGNWADTVNWVGKNDQAFTWKPEDGFFTVVPYAGDLHTKQAFGDCQLHIEWQTPAEVTGNGQGRGNSGIFLMGRYELQVLDSYNNSTYSNGQAGSIYKQHMPLVNVCRPPGEWQCYDIIFTAPQFNAEGFLKSPARMTVLQNGVLIQNNVELWGSMQFIGVPKYEKHADKEPLLLQDHHNTVSYRNIWVRAL
ncbi:MAG: DUF1080 domain-containing protein [Lewinellaceae bacterium]|nr:DUF1080 domain-containing protein [Saprospiraceae bacterium]MCB9330904.1 DUF1080 domain-containing protein [Lewinellaceae bacterium]